MSTRDNQINKSEYCNIDNNIYKIIYIEEIDVLIIQNQMTKRNT
jgi:hypothetical protein